MWNLVPKGANLSGNRRTCRRSEELFDFQAGAGSLSPSTFVEPIGEWDCADGSRDRPAAPRICSPAPSTSTISPMILNSPSARPSRTICFMDWSFESGLRTTREY